MASAGTVLFYSAEDFPETFIEETARIKLKILDSLLGRARILEAIISNPRNVKESIYTPYRRIKVVEKTSGETIFLGRVEITDPSFSEEYGQILTVKCSDYSRELFERKVDWDYSDTPNKRSALISHIITTYTYPGTVSQDIEESGSSDTIARNYTSYDKAAIQVIEELAQEDFWTDETWSATWRWNGSSYDDNTEEANSVAGNQFEFLADTSDYFYLGQASNPFFGADFYLGLQGEYGSFIWEYYNGEDWIELSMLQEYDFSIDGIVKWHFPTNWAAVAFSNGNPHGNDPPDLTSRYWVRVRVDSITTAAMVKQIKCVRGCGYDYYVDDTQTFQYFRRASRPLGGASGNGLTIALNEAESQSKRAMFYDYSIGDKPKEIVTRVTVRGTANDGTRQSHTAINLNLEATYGIVKEKIEYIWSSDLDDFALHDYCVDRAKALLGLQEGIIIRGTCQIARYPYFGANKTLVRVGDLVHIHCAPKNINEDFIILEVSYEEPPGFATINFIGTIYGRSYSPYDLSSVFQGLKGGKDLGVFPAAQIPDLSAVVMSSVAIEFVIDGGGSAITTGEKGHVVIPFDGSIIEGQLQADQAGSIKIDIWKSDYSNFPPDNDDSICADNELEISSGQKDRDTILSSWDTNLTYGDILAFNVDSCSTITRCTIVLICSRINEVIEI